MKRLLPIVALLLLAQTPTTAVLRTPAGDKPVNMLVQNGVMYFAADDVIAALGGAVKADVNGFKATLGATTAAFGPDSRFAVVREDLIEMPVPPLVVDGKPYAVLQFFQGFVSRAADTEIAWDPTARILQARPVQRSVAGVQASVANIQGISKVVLTLTAPSEYTIIKEPGAYTVRFKAQLKPPAPEQAFDDPYVKSIGYAGSDLRIQLTTPDVAADTYRLDNPFRIVIDIRKAAAPAPGTPTLPIPSTKPVEQPGIHTIVIDPGHGGKEVGAIGPGGLMEKDATLQICQKLHDALESKLHARVVLTRTDDSVVSLDQRTAVANQYHADLFLSVHMNAAVVKGAKGSETYFLSLEASDELAKKAAETENATAQRAPENDLKLILWDLAQQQYLQESSRLASDIQEEMNRVHGITNRGVKQAPFKVLVGATMPAALVEVAFITNPTEESKIKSEEFQKTVVDALTTAVQRYKTDYETRIGIVQPPAPAPTTTAPSTTTTTTTTTTTAKKAGT